MVANAGGALRIAGWAVDPQSLGAVEIHVYVDGKVSGTVANVARSELDELDGFGPNHGFDGAHCR